MIESAEEFKRLRTSENPEDYRRAAHDEALMSTWSEILEDYPDMAFWVAQNKTVPVEILEELAKHQDPDVRDMVARKRKIPESLMLILANDSWETVRKRANEKLEALEKQSV